MAWQGDGTFIRTNGTNTADETWQDDAAAGTKIRADRHDTHDQDLADGIAACLTKNNETKPTADFKPNAGASYDLGSAALQWVNAYLSGGVYFTERADHAETPTDTFGEVWLKSETPNGLYFTDDAGTDTALTGRFSVPAGITGYGMGTSLAADTEHDITIAVGSVPDSSRAAMITLSAPLTKRIDTDWVVGDTNGGLAPSARSVADTPNASTTYHLFVIMDSDGLVDAGWDTSATAVNLLSDTSYTYYSRVASCPVDASNNLVGYSQNGDEFLLLEPVRSINDTAPGTAANTYAVDVPTGVQVIAKLSLRMQYGSSQTFGLLSALDQNDTTPAQTVLHNLTDAVNTDSVTSQDIRTDTSAQVRYRQSHASADIMLFTHGWIDTRGRV